jgi:hypothetical protein
MSLSSIVARLIVGFVLLVILSAAGVFTWIFGITPIGIAAGICTNGPSSAAIFYTIVLGVLITIGAILPPALIVFLKSWRGALIALGVIASLNLAVFSVQFWLPFIYCN